MWIQVTIRLVIFRVSSTCNSQTKIRYAVSGRGILYRVVELRKVQGVRDVELRLPRHFLPFLHPILKLDYNFFLDPILSRQNLQ
jgi:hypothetical protein